jgi:hypothetical protein
MKDFLFISHHFGKEGISSAERFLQETDLTFVADLKKDGVLAGYCSLRLPKDDIRLTTFIHEIEKNGDKVHARFDRVYTSKELNNFDYLVLIIRTARLENPGRNQKYDLSDACKECGAGVTLVPPLDLPLNSMGKRLLDCTAHNEWLVFRKELAEKIMNVDFDGISFHPAKVGKNDCDFLWGKIENVLPKLHTTSEIIYNHTKCDTCMNSGNYNYYDRPNTHLYSVETKFIMRDFNLTQEFFGDWEYSKLGGSRKVIISQATRQFLINEKVKYLDFEPIEFI